jgi:type II secretory pathway pseudopilin PulG
MRSPHPHRRPLRAFTLIEMLVVIGIIVLLVGLLMPMVLKSYRAAARHRAAGDMGTVATCLEAYKGDFGTYPAVDMPGTGFAVLGKVIIGPFGDGRLNNASTGFDDTQDPPTWDAAKSYKAGDCVTVGFNTFVATMDSTGVNPPGTAPLSAWVQFDARDFQDGPGFRTRQGGKVYGPYAQSGKLKTNGLAILDPFGNPILYFPASPVKTNLSIGDTFYISSSSPTAPNPQALVAGGGPGMYRFDDSGITAVALSRDPTQTGIVPALAYMQMKLGVKTNYANGGTANGQLVPANGEQPVTQAPFILWSCGPDGRFGPVDSVLDGGLDAKGRANRVATADDVVSFEQ